MSNYINKRTKPESKRDVVKNVNNKPGKNIILKANSKSKANKYYTSKEVENILSKHGGNFRPDFGLPGTLQFNETQTSTNGWSVLLDNISGKSKNQRVNNIIRNINKEKALKHAAKNDSNSEAFLRTFVYDHSEGDNEYFETIYNKYLTDSRDFMGRGISNHVYNENFSSMSPTRLNNNGHNRTIQSPQLRYAKENELSMK